MPANADNFSDSEDHSEPPEPIVAEWTYGPPNVLRPRKFLPDQIMRGGNGELNPDDNTSSGRSDSIVPEVSKSENDEMIVENEKPRGRKYDLRPTT